MRVPTTAAAAAGGSAQGHTGGTGRRRARLTWCTCVGLETSASSVGRKQGVAPTATPEIPSACIQLKVILPSHGSISVASQFPPAHRTRPATPARTRRTMARRDRTARPRATNEPSEAEPAAAAASTSTSTRSSRKRSHADALATDAASGAETPTEVSDDGTKRSKRGKKAKDDVEKVAATAKDGQAPHLAQGASDATTTAATASSSGSTTDKSLHKVDEVVAETEERDEVGEKAPMKVDETRETSPLEGKTAEERRAIKGKGRATITDAQGGADAELERVAGLQKDLAHRDEVSSAFSLSSLRTPQTDLQCPLIAAYCLTDRDTGFAVLVRDLHSLPRETRAPVRSAVWSRLVRPVLGVGRAHDAQIDICCDLFIAAVASASSTGSSAQGQKARATEQFTPEPTPTRAPTRPIRTKTRRVPAPRLDAKLSQKRRPPPERADPGLRASRPRTGTAAGGSRRICGATSLGPPLRQRRLDLLPRPSSRPRRARTRT